MYGRIVKFRDDIGVGVIHAESGDAFRFTTGDLVNRASHLVGTEVDFLISERKPREILLMKGSPWSVFGSDHTL